MDENHKIAEIHRAIIERYPMYQKDPAFETWLHDKAADNAETVEEYLDALSDYGYLDGEGMICGDYTSMPDPSGILDDMKSRLDVLDPASRDVLRAASVEGPTFSAEVVTVLMDGAQADVERAIETAIAADVIRPDGDEGLYAGASRSYRFHPLQLRDMLYGELPGDRRAELHRRTIEFLMTESERATEPGRREMISQLIDEHNQHASRPAGSPE